MSHYRLSIAKLYLCIYRILCLSRSFVWIMIHFWTFSSWVIYWSPALSGWEVVKGGTTSIAIVTLTGNTVQCSLSCEMTHRTYHMSHSLHVKSPASITNLSTLRDRSWGITLFNSICSSNVCQMSNSRLVYAHILTHMHWDTPSWDRSAQALVRESEEHTRRERYDEAFILMARAAVWVQPFSPVHSFLYIHHQNCLFCHDDTTTYRLWLEKIPSHPEYQTIPSLLIRSFKLVSRSLNVNHNQSASAHIDIHPPPLIQTNSKENKLYIN
jgi:hypothetical protein